MDIRSMLNERDAAPTLPAPRPAKVESSTPPIQVAFQNPWHPNEVEASRQQSDMGMLPPQDSSYRRDSAFSSFSSKPAGRARKSTCSEGPPKSLLCYHCRKSFTRRSDLVRHERIHSGIRPHVCAYRGCGKSFIQRSALTIHERVHTGDKPHECQQCGKLFSDSSSLARHRRTHTGVRPYRCDFPGCCKDFTRKTTLSRHRQHHNIKGHIPIAGAAKAGSYSGSSTVSSRSTLSSVSSYNELPSPNVSSMAPSPTLRKPGENACYITFQIAQPDEHDLHLHRVDSAHEQRPSIHHPLSTSADDRIGPRRQDSRDIFRSSLPVPKPDIYRPASRDDDYFSRSRLSSFNYQTPSGSYLGTPLPRIVPNWLDEPNQHCGSLPVSSDFAEHGRRKRRDSAVGNSYWSPEC